MALAASALVFTIACTGPPKVISISEALDSTEEIARLSYFEEINAKGALEDEELTGEGVRVTIMGEMVDVSHPDLAGRVVGQYNTFVRKGTVLRGSGNAPYGAKILGKNDGHGTHIAGTIAAECDGIALQGVACGATLDVYDLGAYDSAGNYPSEGWGDDDEISRFINAFIIALDDLTRRGESRIATGSFNLESPAVSVKARGPLHGLPLAEIMRHVEKDIKKVPDLFNKGLVELENPGDQEFLERVIKANDKDLFIMMGLPLQLSAEWRDLAKAIGRYQASGGVYIVTESNYVFENRTSVLNAMPSLCDAVDEDLWLSVVMVAQKEQGEGEYFCPINSCGDLAANYSIVTPSYAVLSTMTERVALWGDSPLFELDGRFHQAFGGHSMGAPMVAATLALMEEQNVREGYGYSMKDLVRILKESANRSFPGYDPALHGRGMLDVTAAVEAMKK
jgi:subtilisin family serine protease